MRIMTETARTAVRARGNTKLLRDIQAELGRMEQMLLALNGLEEQDERAASPGAEAAGSASKENSSDASDSAGAPGAACNTMRRDLTRVIISGGKRLRPILAYLCYRLGGGGELPVLPLMCMLELMHTASLIHDDVVDGAALRRGAATINATSGTAAAVQSGDFLLAQAMGYLHYYKGTGINEALVRASGEMCLGELWQLKARNVPECRTRALYFRQIHRKTASLLGASCQAGGLAGGLPEEQSEMLKAYGENLGLAFQLADDLLDFSVKPGFGKTPGQDLKNGVYTLPVLYLLEEGVPADMRALLEKMRKDDRDVARLIEFVRASKAPEYTKTVIREKTAAAAGALRGFPESAEKTALIELAERLADRSV